MKRIVAALVLIFVVFNMFAVVFAEEAVPYASRVFNRTTISINSSGGTISALAKVYSNGTASKLGVSSISIQVLNGSTWTTVKTLSASYAYNVTSYSKTISCGATAGKQYRAKVTFSGTVNGVSETYSMTSSTKTAS